MTWEQAKPCHKPKEASEAIKLLFEEPSFLLILEENSVAISLALELASKHKLTARRIHDARHAATALSNGIKSVFTYDVSDWKVFLSEGLKISGPPTTLEKISNIK